MGNRGSISVRNRCYIEHFTGKIKHPEETAVLFRHWGGDLGGMEDLIFTALEKLATGYTNYTERYPSEILALLTMISCEDIQDSAYIGKDKTDGDNSDNGHFILEIGKPHQNEIFWKLFRQKYDWKEHSFKTEKFVKEWKLTLKR